MSDTRIPLQFAIDQFLDAMAEKGITPPAGIEPDGKIHRFSSSGKAGNDAGWYVFHEGAIPAGSFGDFRTGQSVSHWAADIGRDLTPAERSEFRKKQDEMRRVRDTETLQRRIDAKEKAAGILRHSQPATDSHPYLKRKGVKAHGLRVWKDLLVVPMMDESNEVQSLQLISGDGDKKFLAGGKMQGCYFTLGAPKDDEPILIAEGYATAATIFEATGLPAIVAYNAGNLLPVARSIRSSYPHAPLIFCADDDIKAQGNPGVAKANAAAQEVGGRVIIPEFGRDRPEGASDFNDMAAHAGKDAVIRFFANQSLEERDKRDHAQQEDHKQTISRPASQKAAPVSEVNGTGENVTTGTIDKFGIAPYKFDKKNGKSFYLNVKNGDHIKTLWGIDLEKALNESGLGPGDEVAVYHKGKVPVQIRMRITDADGTIVSEEPKTVMKGAWKIGPLHEYVESRLQMAENYTSMHPHSEHTQSHSEIDPEPAAETKAHFSAAEFEIIQRIWKNVPRQAARHAENGYHILIDEKRKVHVSRDRIEFAKKPRHRPDTAYIAACEHARHFWQGQMEVEGDRRHRIKAWAYAQAYGVKITNYEPSDGELIEAEKLLQSIRKDAEPGFRRPSSIRPSTKTKLTV